MHKQQSEPKVDSGRLKGRQLDGLWATFAELTAHVPPHKRNGQAVGVKRQTVRH